MGLNFPYIEGQTPLEEEEKEGLLIKSITTRQQLDEWEQLNIEEAIVWTLRKKFTRQEIFTEAFIKLLHRKMYGDVWAWAGTFRLTDKNIGVPKQFIAVNLKQLLDDTQYWISHEVHEPNDIAIRFKHRLVSIHCFANGNGRHSRLIADLIAAHVFAQKPFSWGGSSLVRADVNRKEYLQSLWEADKGAYARLLQFARS